MAATLQRQRRPTAPVVLLTVGMPAIVYWRTAYPTITWWDSSSYSLASATLGINSPPGSLLLMLLGWPIAHLPSSLGSAYLLNLLAGCLAATAAGLVFLVARRLLAADDDAFSTGPALGALVFAFSATLWEHAIKFTPYVLTAVFTGLILLTLVRWWDDAERNDSWRWIGLLALLFGLDFSVHRTNALLVPGALAWILVRHPGTVVRWRAWVAGAGGLAAGLAVHLLVIPISAGTASPLNMFAPNTWSRFWEYVALPNAGGNFLIDLWPRKSDLWSVQAADLLRILQDNFFHLASPLRYLGALPALAILAGIIALWRRGPRLGAAFTLALLLQAAMTVLYFNIPRDYFRPFDRHYLPVFVTCAVAAGCGLGLAVQLITRSWHAGRRVMPVMGTMLVAVIPAVQLLANWQARNASRRYFTRDYAANALLALPPRAIYFTAGDNDSFPVWYLQTVEGVRPDVSIVNLSMLNASWYVDQLMRAEPSFPLSPGARAAPPPRAWTAGDVEIPIEASAEQLGLAAEDTVPVSITVRPTPSMGAQPIPADFLLLDIVRTNRWRRPLAFAITAGQSGLTWLRPYARLEGLHWRVMPVERPRPDADVLSANLLERYQYRGYADPAIPLDDVTRTMGMQYVTAFRALLEAEAARLAPERCRGAAAEMAILLPLDRLGVPPGERPDPRMLCGS